jgi:hypothetical protein
MQCGGHKAGTVIAGGRYATISGNKDPEAEYKKSQSLIMNRLRLLLRYDCPQRTCVARMFLAADTLEY